MIPKKATPATWQKTGADKVRREVQVTKIVGTLSSESRLYPFYSDIEQSAPAKFLSLADLVCMAIDPSIGPKHKAAALTPFNASAKRKEVALISEFHALVTDHDDDDKTAEQIRATYDPWGVAYLAYTSASHEQEKHGITGKRWKPVIPLASPVSYERYNVLSRGLMLMNGTDAVQSRSQQVFYAPNKISKAAPFDYIDETERPFLDPHDDNHPLIKACVEAYEAEAQKQEATASKATLKPRPTVTGEQAGIIGKVLDAYSDIGALIDQYDYKRAGSRWRCPNSTSGIPGVVRLTGSDGRERLYSHHGEADPLSNLNNDGHALDVFDVLVALEYGGDFSRAVCELAKDLDPEGQKQRQRDHMAAKEAEQAAAEFKKEIEADPAAAQAVDLFDNLTPPPFPLDLLPPAIADYAWDQAELIGVDPAVIALAALGAAAACIDDRIEIQPKRHDTGWREQARLWVGIIGDPSAKKSPGISKAMAPLFKIDREWREETAQANTEWREACDDTPKGEKEPPAPIGKRLILNDTTVEKMGDIMNKSEPRGMLSYRDELSGWLAGMDAYKNGAGGKDKAAWLEAYNGGPMAIDRISRGSIFVKNCGVCVLGGIQPSLVQAYAQSTNHDGMLQRFILLNAGEARLGADRPPDLAARERYNFIMEQMADTQEAGHSVVTLSEEAHLVREALDIKLHKLTINHPNKFLAAALGKWNGLFARLLLTFHCVEAATDHEHPCFREVSGETAHRVSDLMWRTLLPHAVAFYQGLDPVEDTARELAALILAHEWERFTVKRDLNRYWRASRKLKPWELEETLDRLEAFSWIFPQPGHLDEKGKPAAYLVNPGVHTRFTEQAERERERRKEVTAMIADLKP